MINRQPRIRTWLGMIDFNEKGIVGKPKEKIK